MQRTRWARFRCRGRRRSGAPPHDGKPVAEQAIGPELTPAEVHALRRSERLTAEQVKARDTPPS